MLTTPFVFQEILLYTPQIASIIHAIRFVEDDETIRIVIFKEVEVAFEEEGEVFPDIFR